MNQDHVKELLLEIEDCTEHFDVLFTGKGSKKVDGFYRPEERQIYIHNKNMKDDNQLVYTAIHEYAHHLHTISSPLPVGNRCHTREFWASFHRLLGRAEEKGIYKNLYKTEEELVVLTRELKEKYLTINGELMKDFGRKLMDAQRICYTKNISFEDYADRELGLGRTIAKSIMKVSAINPDATIGFENMKAVASIPNPAERIQAQEAFKQGLSRDTVKTMFGSGPKKAEMEPNDRLVQEKKRLEKTIDNLSKRLEEIDAKLLKAGIEA